MSCADSVLVVLSVGAVLLWGLFFARRQRSSSEFFTGSRTIPWPVACFSLVATETSGITFLGVPELAFRGNWTFLQMAFGYLAGRVLVAWFLVAAVRRGATTSVYEYVSRNLGPRVGGLCACVFLLTRLLADGVRLYVTAVPLRLVTGFSLLWSIGLILAVTTLYSLLGGIRGIVWLDTVQLVVYLLGAALSVCVIAAALGGGLAAGFSEALREGRLQVVDLSLALDRYTLCAGILGGAAFSFASHGTDHLMAQRYLLVQSDGEARRVVIGSGVAVLLQFSLFLLLGTCLYCLWGHRDFPCRNEVYATFIVEKLPPVLRGIVLSGIFAAAMSTLSSSINALAASGLRDVAVGLFGLSHRFARSVASARWTSLACAVSLGLCAVLFSEAQQNVVDLAMGIASVTYGGMLGLFVLSRLGTVGAGPAAGGLLAGSLVALYLFFFPVPGVGKVFWPYLVPSGAAVTVLTGLSLQRLSKR